jgi:hypothetical protein
MRGDKKKRFTLVTWMDQLGEIDVLQPGEDPGEPVSEVKQGYIYAAERGFIFQPRCFFIKDDPMR